MTEKIGSIDMNEVNLKKVRCSGIEASRGNGIHKVKKGRGSYKRKKKHKKEVDNA